MKLIMDDGREYSVARVARTEMNPGDVLVVSCKDAQQVARTVVKKKEKED